MNVNFIFFVVQVNTSSIHQEFISLTTKSIVLLTYLYRVNRLLNSKYNYAIFSRFTGHLNFKCDITKHTSEQ